MNFALHRRSDTKCWDIARSPLSCPSKPITELQSDLETMFASEILSVSHYFMDLLLSQAASLPSQTWQDQPEWPIAVAQAIRFRARWCPSLVSGCEELLGRSANPLPRRCYAGTWSHYLKNLLRLPPLTVASSLLEILPSEQLAKQGRAYPKNVQAFHGVKPSIPLASGLNR